MLQKRKNKVDSIVGTLEVTSNPVTKQPDLFSYLLSCVNKIRRKKSIDVSINSEYEITN